MARHIIWIGAVALALGLSVGGCKKQSGSGGGAAPVTLRYANFPPAATFPCVQMEHWKAEVEKRTGGKVSIKTFPGSTLLAPTKIYDGVDSGVADIGCFAMSYQPGKFPVSEAVDLPLGFTSSKVASLTLFDLIKKQNPKEFQNVKILTMFTCPPVNLMTSKPVKSLADMKGMKLRAAGTGVEALTLLGAAPTGMPQSEVPDAIQKNVISGIASSLEVIQDMNYASYCGYCTTNVNMNVVTFAVVMNKKKWDSLPDDVKKAMDVMAREHAAWTGDYADKHVQDALAWAKQKNNVQVLELPAAEAQQVQTLLQPMIEKYLAKVDAAGLNGQQILSDVRAIKAAVEKEGK